MKTIGKLPFILSWYFTSTSLRDKGSTWCKWSQVRVYSKSELASDVFVCSLQAAVFFMCQSECEAEEASLCSTDADSSFLCSRVIHFLFGTMSVLLMLFSCWVAVVHIFTEFHTRISDLVSVSRKNGWTLGWLLILTQIKSFAIFRSESFSHC